MLLANQSGLPIEFTQGDAVTLNLILTDDQGNPANLTGASLSTQILGANGFGPITFPNGQHTIANQTTDRGKFTLTLSPTDTGNCGEGTGKQIITDAVISANPTYYRGNNILTVFPAVPLQ